jgi:hypothetical protein
MSYFIGRGKVYFSTRSVTGKPDGFLYLGHCPRFMINPSKAFTRFATGTSLTTVVPKIVPAGELPTFDMDIDEFTQDNMHLLTGGKRTDVEAGTVVGELLTAKKGAFIPTAHMHLISLTIAAYTEGSDYTVDLEAGGIHIPSTSSIANGASVSVNYSFNGYQKVGMQTSALPMYWVRLNGSNLVDDTPVVVDIFKARINPPGQLQLVGDDFSSITVSGNMYYDELQSDTETDGRILRIRNVVT